MGGGGKSPEPIAPPDPEEFPTREEEKEPLSKSIRDSNLRKIRAQNTGHAGNILHPLGAAGAGVAGLSQALGLPKQVK